MMELTQQYFQKVSEAANLADNPSLKNYDLGGVYANELTKI